jgi:hypothetical protein
MRFRQSPAAAEPLKWLAARDLDVEGCGFADTASDFDRLPARAETVVRKAVWDLSRFSAGVVVRFQTDAPAIHVRYQLFSESLAMPHMPATSVSGVDLYAADDAGRMLWAAVLKPDQPQINTQLLGNIRSAADGRPRRFDLYLPLFNRPDGLEIGIDQRFRLESAAPRQEKPVVFYGTSIMHGACASRSGMSISSILGRRLQRPVINLGFSGNGRMEPEVGRFLCELDPAVYVIDCLPNLNPARVTERCEPLVRQLRQARPDTPILLVEDRVFTNAWIREGAGQFHAANRKALREAFQRLIADGVEGLHYLPGKDLLGHDHEAATDGSHPSDLGMMRYADVYEPVLQRLLQG